jgi:hypothetical protein
VKSLIDWVIVVPALTWKYRAVSAAPSVLRYIAPSPLVVEGTPEPLRMNPDVAVVVLTVKRLALNVPIGNPVEVSVGPSAFVYWVLPVLSL